MSYKLQPVCYPLNAECRFLYAIRHTLYFAVFAMLTAAGCTSSEQFYEEARLSRDVACRQWKKQKENQQQSQTKISGRLSMEDCLKLMLVNNKTLQKIIQEKEIARGEEIKSYSAIFPSVGLTGNYTRLDKANSFGPQTIGDVDNYSAGLNVTQPLFSGGAITARLNAGKLFTLLADQTVKGAVQEVTYAVQRAYYDVLLDQHLLDIGTDAVRSAQAHLDNVKQRKNAGIASDFDVLRAEVELSNFQAELIQYKNAINVANAKLLKVMGVSQDSSISLSDELVFSPLNVTIEYAVETAYKNRPDLFGHQLNVRLQKEFLDIEKSRYWPAVTGFYDNIWSRPDPRDPTAIEWADAWQAGIMSSWPVFDGFAREGSVIQQKARFKQSQIDLIDKEENALFELTKSKLSIEDAEEFVESQKMNLARAQEGLRLAEVGYRQGINTQVEMIDAQEALTKAKVFYYQSIYSHLVSKLDMQKAMGVLTLQIDPQHADENIKNNGVK